MKLRKLLHLLAIAVSSLGALIPHARAEDDSGTGAKRKKTEGAHHRHHHAGGASAEASQDPPQHKHGTHTIASWHNTGTVGLPADAPPPTPIRLSPAIMATAERDEPPAMPRARDIAPLPGDEHSRYPWRRQIVTTIFWIGESASANNPVPNRASCWDPHWSRNYGGDDPDNAALRTAQYIPATFKPGLNPFYVALPYNDMEHGAHKAEAAQIIPWFAREYKGPTKSVCRGRWIAIRFKDRVCYAQWEDAGPFRTDHWQYVFGNERPRWNLNRGAGLDVSPAVRDYLGMHGTDVTDWKFVEFDEVPSGPWAQYGENNTFVQNARKGPEVAELREPAAEAIFGHHTHGGDQPTVEVR